jgi:hypothetical protein
MLAVADHHPIEPPILREIRRQARRVVAANDHRERRAELADAPRGSERARIVKARPTRDPNEPNVGVDVTVERSDRIFAATQRIEVELDDLNVAKIAHEAGEAVKVRLGTRSPPPPRASVVDRRGDEHEPSHRMRR